MTNTGAMTRTERANGLFNVTSKFAHSQLSSYTNDFHFFMRRRGNKHRQKCERSTSKSMVAVPEFIRNEQGETSHRSGLASTEGLGFATAHGPATCSSLASLAAARSPWSKPTFVQTWVAPGTVSKEKKSLILQEFL